MLGFFRDFRKCSALSEMSNFRKIKSYSQEGKSFCDIKRVIVFYTELKDVD